MLAQAVRAWQADGRQVVLLAQQGAAADVAAREIGWAGEPVPALTLARVFGNDDGGPGSAAARSWLSQLAAAAGPAGRCCWSTRPASSTPRCCTGR